MERPLSKGFIYLTQAQIDEYQQYIQNGEFVLPAEVIERDILPQLFGGNSEEGSGNDFLMNHPAVRLCIGVGRGDPGCSVDTKPPDETEEEGPILLAKAKETPPGLTKPKDVFGLIARQMEHVTAPEGIVNFGVEPQKRAGAGAIAESVGKLQFEKGLAKLYRLQEISFFYRLLL